LKYLSGYPEQLRTQVQQLLDLGQLGRLLQSRYRGQHEVRTDKALYAYVLELKNQYLRGAEPVNKVLYDNKLQLIAQALGTHTTVSRVQGNKLKAKREIRIASLFRDLPEPFLRMIVVHELAHLREKQHDKAFYQLCTHMEGDYHQLELDLRLVLTHLDAVGTLSWNTDADAPLGTRA
jgi:predicted metal-dependent hydrolase